MFGGRKAPERRPRVATDITATRTRVQGTEFLAGRYRLYENSLDNRRATERRLASSALGKVLARAIRLLMESRIYICKIERSIEFFTNGSGDRERRNW